MGNSYQYIDPDFLYSDSNGVLINLANIKDDKVLLAFESLKVSKRLEELFDNPILISDSYSILKIHHHLFQDIYSWAGEVRTVNISKDGKQFFEGERFPVAFQFINSLIDQYRKIESSDLPALANHLALILDNMNFLHPFREGNGRAQREFLRVLALEKNITLNLNPADNLHVYQKYMQGTINSDVQKLSSLIFEEMSKK
jgi:cell filamentation protein